MKIMTNLDLHLNLVNLLGSCTAEMDSRNLWLLIEFCPHGDLKSFLISNRQQFKNNIKGKYTFSPLILCILCHLHTRLHAPL